MYKLLSANLSRLWNNKGFFLTVISMNCAEGLCCLFLLQQNSMPMDILLFLSIQCIGIMTSIFFSLFLGTEYSDGTIRNKLIVGHKRSSIYLANFITGIAAVTVIYLAGVLTGAIFGLIFFAPANHGLDQIVLAGVIAWLAGVAYIAIFTFIGMLSSSKARTSINCIMTAFILMFIGLLCYSLARPGLMTGAAGAVCQFLLDFNPFGQTSQAMSFAIASPARLVLYPLFLSSVLTRLGMYLFQKKDIK